ncbi:hypothetical protein SDC9_186040 [bioreactor metagenome]|uniref:Uncharacterized protein n=1 Tax=bioreactor metagenome TaxID=1076179 RepID=A0A645HIS3_9ZZZZ
MISSFALAASRIVFMIPSISISSIIPESFFEKTARFAIRFLYAREVTFISAPSFLYNSVTASEVRSFSGTNFR